jgi:hypothetical protein
MPPKGHYGYLKGILGHGLRWLNDTKKWPHNKDLGKNPYLAHE